MRKASLVAMALLLQGYSALAAIQSAEAMAASATLAAAKWKDKIIDFLIQRGPSVLGAFIVMVAGWVVAGMLYKLVDRALVKKQLEPPIRMLICRVAHLLVLGLFLIIALDTAGFKMTTLIAGISVAGVGVGLAMQGLLGNLVAGLVIIFTKPFRVGEYIDIIGEEGQVHAIELFTTVLTHPDRSRVIIPNRKIIGEVLHNYGTVRQLDLTVGVAYSTKLPDALAAIREVLRDSSRVAKEITPYVGVTALADSSINISVKPWVPVSEYGLARVELYQSIVERFRERKVAIPFPQREIRVLNGEPSASTNPLKVA